MSSTSENSNSSHNDQERNLRKERSHAKGIITKITNQLKELMWDYDNVEEVSRKLNDLHIAFQNFDDIHKRFHSLLKDEEEINDSREYYDSEHRKVGDMIYTIDHWIDGANRRLQKTLTIQSKQSGRKPAEIPEINPQDSISNVASNVYRKSASKSGSKKSSNASSKLKEKVERQAFLEVEISMLKQRQTLEIEQLNIQSEYERNRLLLEQRQRELSLTTEMNKLNIEERLRNESRQTDHFNSPQQQSHDDNKPDEGQISITKGQAKECLSANLLQSNVDEKPVLPSFENRKVDKLPTSTPIISKPLDPNSFSFHPKTEHCTNKLSSSENDTMNQSVQAINRMADLQQLQQRQNQQVQELLKQQREQTIAMTLPQPELPVFSGDPIEYNNFVRAFDNLIEAKTTNSSSKLYYLIQYTEGDVKELMQSCLSMKPDDGYKTARQLLKNKYGQSYKIASAYVERITNVTPIKSEDGLALQKFSVLLTSCKNTLKEIGFVNKIENPDSMQKIVEKLPFNLRHRWRDVADDITENKKRDVTIEDIANFVELKARAANHPIFGTIVNEPKNRVTSKNEHKFSISSRRHNAITYTTQSQPLADALDSVRQTKPPVGFSTHSDSMKVNYTSTSSGADETKPKVKCYMCDGDHWLARCEAFKRQSVEERLKFVRDKGLCDNCLNAGHMAKRCPKENFCKVTDCTIKHRKHSTFLHPRNDDSTGVKDTGKGSPNASSTDQHSTTTSKNGFVNVADQGLCTATGAGTMRTALSIVPVKVKSTESDTELETYALLDPGSNTTFCTERLINELNITESTETILSLTTMDSDKAQSKSRVVSLIVTDLEGANTVQLPKVFSRNKLPVSKEDIPSQTDVHRWPHLNDIKLKEIDADIELLIGNDVPLALQPHEVKPSVNGGPYAVRTLLGWTINGPIQPDSNVQRKANRIHADNMLNLQFEQFCNREFNDSHNDIDKAMSQEDVRALRMMNDSCKLDDGHYTVSLPWRVYPPNLPDNKLLAEQRLSMLKKRLSNDDNLHCKYTEFMNTLIEKNYAQPVPDCQLQDAQLPRWYLPHHPVVNQHKPDKVRVVFDCAAKFNGTSLNYCIMQGPDLTNTLVGVLTRFRKEQTAVMGDIESMFYQVNVAPEDRTYLRYLWWPEGDLSKLPQEYQMRVHLFGGVSSPSCASYGLRKTAEDNELDFDELTVNTVKDNFYVDDCLASVESEDKAIELVDQLRNMLSKGGFRLTKWISNSRRVIESIPVTERASSVRDLNLDLEHLPIERALGILWNVELDVFNFKITLKDSPLTRRGVLSVVSSIYDPLGFASPVLLPAKELLQELCKQGRGWDDQLSIEEVKRWNSWLKQLPQLEELEVDRCVKPTNFGTVVSTQLHNFADASSTGYGAVSYLRIVNTKGEIYCAFLMGKSRLAPLKAITIPRLELSAAVVATRLSDMIHKELNMNIDETYFWTDSTCVLGYILNQERRFHTFVANRVATIHSGSQPNQWFYVTTNSNPADDASRGLTPDELVKKSRWIHGPAFLWKEKEQWPKQPDVSNKIKDDDPEVKTEQKVATVITDKSNPLEHIIEHFSSWYRLKKCVAWLLRYRANLLRAVNRRKLKEETNNFERKPTSLTVKELQIAEREILRHVQNRTFSKEMSLLKSTNSQPMKSSSIYKLKPIITDGVLRVGGRLQNAPIDDDSKHPVVVPKDHHVAVLIARYHHECTGHSGTEHTLSSIRQTYWIVKARSIVRRIVNQCVRCRKRQASPATQVMADLPVDRVLPGKPPFTFVGVDCFGPFTVRRARSEIKRYGVLYTCLTTRAIHIEIAFTMDTDSFINSLRRFIARRGKPELIRSDNGTNFTAGNRELKQAIKDWNEDKVHDFLLQRNIEWKFNPPTASHQGGVWERCIRTVRKVLNSLLQEQKLDDEGLATLMCEVESIINSRPITKSSDDSNDVEALTPNHLLLLRPCPNLPPGIFSEDDTYSRRRWKQIQYMANLFWSRWIKEYLPQLQQRQKWLKPSKNMKVNDIVFIVDDKLPRSSWLIGRVTEVHTNRQDGCVRSVTVKTKNSELKRPITKIVLLESLQD